MIAAIGQMRTAPLDRPGDNMAEALRLAEEAAAGGARLLVLPEGCLTGNALRDPARQAVLPEDPAAFRPLSEVAARTGLTVCAGLTVRMGEKFNVVHAILRPEGPPLFQHKAFRASTEPAHLAAWPDPARVPFTVEGRTVVIAICSEFGQPAVMESVRRCRPDLVLHPSAGCMKEAEVWRPGRENDPPVRDFEANCLKIVENAAAKMPALGFPKMGSNPVGFDGETWWPGNGYAVSAKGEILSWVKGENRPDRMVSRLGFADIG